MNRQYTLGSHYSSFEVGFKGWDARKTSLNDREAFNAAGGQPMTAFLGNFHASDYYMGRYTFGPVTQYTKIAAALAPGGTTPELTVNLPNDYDIGERIWAGYLMNTISLGKLRLQTGVRVESTGDNLLGNIIATDPSSGNVTSVSPLHRTKNYTNVFPSVEAQYALTSNTVLRAAYSMAIARPNFSGLPPFEISDPNSNPTVPVTAGNPNLGPTHAQNFDLLAEHYMSHLGLIQGGVFYKSLTDPIYAIQTVLTSGAFAGQNALLPINGPHAHLTGVEMAWQQQLSFLPGVLNGMGVRANYSYVTSRATLPVGTGRTDHPTLLRTAPNNWNFDVTYDKKGISARMGLTHNDAYIWSYGGSNAHDPSGDTYLYPHTQVDAQVSYWIPRGHGLQVIASMLNLNNEVFGFYHGSERYPIQREYYQPTYSFGLRWTLRAENK